MMVEASTECFRFTIEKGASCQICKTQMFPVLLAATTSINLVLEVHVAIENFVLFFLESLAFQFFLLPGMLQISPGILSAILDCPFLQLSPCHWCLLCVIQQTFHGVKVLRPTLRSTRDVEIYASRGFAFGLL